MCERGNEENSIKQVPKIFLLRFTHFFLPLSPQKAYARIHTHKMHFIHHHHIRQQSFFLRLLLSFSSSASSTSILFQISSKIPNFLYHRRHHPFSVLFAMIFSTINITLDYSRLPQHFLHISPMTSHTFPEDIFWLHFLPLGKEVWLEWK